MGLKELKLEERILRVLHLKDYQAFIFFESMKDIVAFEELSDEKKVVFDNQEMTKRDVLSIIGIDYIARGVTTELSEAYLKQKYALSK